MSEETITIRKESLWKYSTFVLITILVVGAFVFFFQNNNVNPSAKVINNPSPDVPAQGARVEVSIDDDPIMGDKNAPVTIIEFSDYQCPFCRKFWQDTLPQLKKEYIDTGKIKLVYRDFPLESIHPSANIAAQAANCAREKGGDSAYFKMHDKIFEEQNKLDGGSVRSTVQFTTEDIKKWAKDIGYDIGSCIDSGKYKDEIQKDFDDGGNYGIQGTPGFFVNGQEVSGAQPFSVFKQIIDAKLAG